LLNVMTHPESNRGIRPAKSRWPRRSIARPSAAMAHGNGREIPARAFEGIVPSRNAGEPSKLTRSRVWDSVGEMEGSRGEVASEAHFIPARSQQLGLTLVSRKPPVVNR
jgi:hypothetical protein